MARGRKESKGKKINPTIYVFCEGKTEAAYISFLKSVLRVPSVYIHTRIKRNNISENYIKNYKQDKPTHEKDKDFLLYDIDIPGMFERLSSIEDVTLLISNPSIELWFLLHYKNQSRATNAKSCCRELKNRNGSYKKGVLDIKLKNKLAEKMNEAIKRARNQNSPGNPSTSIYRLVEELIAINKEK